MSDSWGGAEKQHFMCAHCGVYNEGTAEADYTSREMEPDSPEWIDRVRGADK